MEAEHWRPLVEAAIPGGIQTGPFGSQLHAREYASEGVPVVMPQDLAGQRIDTSDAARVPYEVAERLGRHQLAPGDIVYARRGDLRRRALVKDDEAGWLCGTGCLRVRLTERGDPRYVFYALGHPIVTEWIDRHAVGATMPNLNTTIMSACPIPLPSLSEQRARASVLGALDDKIEGNRRLAGRLHDLALAHFRHLFGERVEGPTPLTEVTEVTGGRSYKSSELASSTTALVSLKSVAPGGGYQSGGLKPFTGSFKESQAVRAGEIIVAMTDLTQAANVVGRSVRAPNQDEFETLVASLDLAVLRPRPPMSNAYLYGLLHSRAWQQQAHGYANGSTVLHLSKAAFSEFLIERPMRAEVESLDALSDPLYEMADCTRAAANTLSALRDALLPKLVSGQIRIPLSDDPEEQLGAAAEGLEI